MCAEGKKQAVEIACIPEIVKLLDDPSADVRSHAAAALMSYVAASPY